MNIDKSSLSNSQQQQLIDLFFQRATAGLTDDEQVELDRLTLEFDNPQELERLEMSASACELSFTHEIEKMPQNVRDGLLIAAGEFFGTETETVDSIDDQLLVTPQQNERSWWSSPTRREVLAIGVAAASLCWLLNGFSFQPTPPTATARLEQLIASQPVDLVDVAWKPIHNPDASGRVVWIDVKQEGYLVFAGMEVNAPAIEQYQLWIFDGDKQQETPVDGGVFNIGESDRQVIPIKAHVPVDQAVQFAVTIERPGGVTVFKRERIPVLAVVDRAK